MSKDLLWVWRWLRRNPLFAAVVTAILALGIGANTAVFSIVDAVLLRPLPYESSLRLVRVTETSTKRPQSPIPATDYLRWRDRTDLFEETVPYLKDWVTLTGGGEPDQVIAMRTSGALFPLLGVRARLGRTLVASDDDPGAANVTLLSDRLWQRRFHGDPAVVGRSITISDTAYTIAGVMPPEFEFEYPNIELWTPLRVVPTTPWFSVAALLRPGVSAARAQSALAVVAQQMEREDPQQKAGLRFEVSRWAETPDRNYELTLVLVLAAVGLVLLIAAADAGGLLLSRAVERQREIAIRASLGAGFWRIARQLLAESLLLSLLGSASGIALAHFLLRFLLSRLAALPIVLPHLQRVGLNGRVLLFSTALCLLLAVLCGIAPVLLAARTDLQAVLRGGTAGAGRRGSTRLFSALIACEAAFAFLLMVGSGLMIRSLIRLEQEDHGFRPDHVLTLRVPVGTLTQPRPTGKYDTRQRQMAYFHELLERVAKTPGIQAVGIVNNLPLSGVNTSLALPVPDGTSARTVSPGYFAAMGIPLLAGRAFSDEDRQGSPAVAIINQYLARQLFANRSPLGLPLPGESGRPGTTVVGVVKDTSQARYDVPARGEIYLPIRQFVFAAFMATIVVRTPGDPLSVAAALQKEVWAVDPNQPVVKVETMDDVIADSIWRPRFSAWIFTVLGVLAVLLTSAGVYSVVAYTTTLRAREVGIRMALGAGPRQVVSVIVRGALLPLSLGLAVSVAAAMALSRLLDSLLYGVGSHDPLTFAGAAALLLTIGAAASARPAWRAAVSDPVKALRIE